MLQTYNSFYSNQYQRLESIRFLCVIPEIQVSPSLGLDSSTPMNSDNEDDIIKGVTNDQPYNPEEQTINASYHDDTLDVDEYVYQLPCTCNLHSNLLSE